MIGDGLLFFLYNFILYTSILVEGGKSFMISVAKQDDKIYGILVLGVLYGFD